MDDTKHEKALDLTEAALEKMVDGDDAAAKALLDQAKALDPDAPAEVVRDLDEDAADRGEG